MNTVTTKNLNHSVAKAFEMLEYFTPAKPEWGVRELAQQLGANKSTIYRFMATLENRGVLQKDPVSEKYRLGLKLFELGNRVNIHRAFIDQTHPVLEQVAAEITETVHLGILREQQVFMVDKIESPKGLKLNSIIGTYSPAYCSGLGKVLLSHLKKDRLDKTLSMLDLEAKTKFTISKKELLIRELQQVRQQGYAIDREELEEGLICVAVPVYNEAGKIVAAISAAGPANRFREEAIDVYVSILQKGADNIRSKIGHFQPQTI